MATNLIDTLDSNLIKAESAFRSSSAKPHVVVYVEDDLDIAFWRERLVPFARKIDFSINTIKDTSGNDKYGKDYLLTPEMQRRYGPNLWACIDSDYDLIIDGWNNHNYYTFIRESPFVISTVTYSIENAKCFSNNLSNLYHEITKTSNDEVDFEKILSFFSKTISDLFVINLISESHDDGVYTQRQFKADLSGFKYSKNYVNNWSFFAESLNQNYSNYFNKNKTLSNILLKKIKKLGFQAESIFFLIPGHKMQSLVIDWLHYFCKNKSNNRIKELLNNPNKSACKKYQNELLNNCPSLKKRVEQCVIDCNRIDESIAIMINQKIENAISHI